MSEPVDIQAAYQLVQSALNETNVPHAFIGALPVVAWGRTRATTDLDLVVACSEEEWPALAQALLARGFLPGRSVGPAEPSDRLPDIAVFWSGSSPAVRVDVFIAKLDFEREVLASARTVDLLGGRIRLASPEASITYKLIASRHRDLDDVEWIFEARRVAGEALDWDFLDRWAAAWEITDRLAPYRAKYGPP